jgi:hypothetical protein
MNVVIPKRPLVTPRNGIVRTPGGVPLPGSVNYRKPPKRKR